MTESLSVTDLSAYLQATGWILQEEAWHGASVWLHGSGRVVLVPPTDTAPDTERRLGETLRALSSVELRATGEIVREIVQPYADMQTYWTFPDGDSLQLDTLTGRYDALHSIRRILLAAAESLGTEVSSTAAEQASISGYSRREINALMQRVELVPVDDTRRLAIRVPVGEPTEGGTGLASDLLPRLAGLIEALHGYELAPQPNDLRPLLDAGVSASLCQALSVLTGRRRDRPLQVDFRWARGRPSSWESRTVWFDAGWGERVAALADRLRDGFEASATVVGRVQSLHGQGNNDRWIVKIAGELDEAGGSQRRNLRVLLPDGEAYDQALDAHRNDRTVRATGQLVTRGTHRELLVETGGFEVAD